MDCCHFKQPLGSFESSVISETHLNEKPTCWLVIDFFGCDSLDLKQGDTMLIYV